MRAAGESHWTVAVVDVHLLMRMFFTAGVCGQVIVNGSLRALSPVELAALTRTVYLANKRHMGGRRWW